MSPALLERGPVTLEAVEEALRAQLDPGFAARMGGILGFGARYAKEPVFCANPASWHPTLWVVQQHHHPALSWRRELLRADPDVDTSWWTLGGYCGLCHDAYHTLLNMYVRVAAKEQAAARAASALCRAVNRAALEAVVPPWSVRRTFGTFVRDGVAEAWRRRPPVTPYT